MSFLPLSDREYLSHKGVRFQESEHAGQKGVILFDVRLPIGKFDAEKVDVLVLIPAGYPDVNPDMFYTFPWIRLAQAGRYPRAADQPVTFLDKTWQRWSRHSAEWRPGRDGLQTMVKRIEFSFESAQA